MSARPLRPPKEIPVPMPLRDVRRLRAALRVLERELALDLREQTGACGVTTAQCHALLELSLLGPVTATELARAMGLDKSTLSRTVEGLEKAGLVERAPHLEDARARRLTLTAAGRAQVKGIDRACDGGYRALLRALPQERRGPVLEAIELLGQAMQRTRRDGPAVERKGR